jgi:hypothetical protein
VEKLRKISLLMLMSLVLVSGMLASALAPVKAQYLIGATPKFYMYLSPNGLNYFNATAAHSSLTIGSKYNLTIGIANVTHMNAFGISMIWNSSQMTFDGNFWLSPFMTRETTKQAGQTIANWSGPYVTYMGNDISDDMFSGILGNPHIGAVESFACTGNTAKHNLTGTFDILIMEFTVNYYGAEGFYLWKDPTGYSPTNASMWPLPQCYQEYVGAHYYGILPGTTYWITSSGWMDTSGAVQSYDVVWCINPYFNPATNTMIPSPIANAVVWINAPAPSAPVANMSYTPTSPAVGQTVTVTVTQKSAGFNGTASCPITNVTINFGDGSPHRWKAPVAGVATFTHNYTAIGSYTIKAYCYAANMPSNLAWCNLTSTTAITVVPEFPAYLLMPLFLTTTTIAVAVAKIMWSKKPKGRVNFK